MRILALELSVAQASIALLENGELVHETVLAAARRTAQVLAPAMADIFQQADWRPRSIDLVAVTSGPGSFTGLRIAVTTAKTFAYAAAARLVALDTLHVLVEQLPADVQHACAVMDAQRHQLFAAVFRRLQDQTWSASRSCQVIDRHELSRLIPPSTVLTGPILPRLAPPFLERQSRSDPACWMPQARTVGRLAWQSHLAGRYDDPLQLQPQYHRPSYAEEKPHVVPGDTGDRAGR